MPLGVMVPGYAAVQPHAQEQRGYARPQQPMLRRPMQYQQGMQPQMRALQYARPALQRPMQPQMQYAQPIAPRPPNPEYDPRRRY